MLIGARTGAWSGGAKLPYDAEVEWIRRPVDGANVRWILPYKPETDDVIEWTASVESVSGSYIPAGFSSYKDEQTEATRIVKRDKSISSALAYFRRIAGGGGFIIDVDLRNANKFVLQRNSVKVNGVVYTIGDVSALSENRGSYTLLSGEGTTLYGFKITRAGEPLCDLVPVRFTEDGMTAGGFYDKVTRVLHKKEDQFTGPYEIGHDK